VSGSGWLVGWAGGWVDEVYGGMSSCMALVTRCTCWTTCSAGAVVCVRVRARYPQAVEARQHLRQQQHRQRASSSAECALAAGRNSCTGAAPVVPKPRAGCCAGQRCTRALSCAASSYPLQMQPRCGARRLQACGTPPCCAQIQHTMWRPPRTRLHRPVPCDDVAGTQRPAMAGTQHSTCTSAAPRRAALAALAGLAGQPAVVTSAPAFTGVGSSLRQRRF
jgi:hypothetical protein